MRAHSSTHKQLPVVRLILAQPFLDAARRDGVSVDDILSPLGLDPLTFTNPDIFVPAATMYNMVETLAGACSDPCIGAHIGLQLNPFSWPPLIDAARVSQSVGDFLLRFSIDAYKDANSVIFQLQTRGVRTSFSELRLTNVGRTPRHNDAFGVAYLLQILKAAVGSAWNGGEVLAEVSEPAVLPKEFYGIRVATTETNGFSLSFPCEWLLLKPVLEQPHNNREDRTSSKPTPDSVLDVIAHVLSTNLENQNLRADHVARMCGLSRRTLSRKLTTSGTTLNREIAALRAQRAKELLADSQLSIAKVSIEVGYNDASVFTRAFKRWTGTTPTAYRNAMKKILAPRLTEA
jgi:AraC-like DNA-binding protein